MIADPKGPSFITRTVGHRRYSDGASVTHDPNLPFVGKARAASLRIRKTDIC